MINSRLYHRLMRCEDRSLFSLFLFVSIVPGSIFSAELETYASYHIAVDDKLTEMHVQLCFFQQVPDALTTGSRIAHRALKNLRIEGNLVPARDKSRGIIYLKALSPRQCLYYDVDLSIAMTEGRVTRFGQPGQADILLRVSSWLWLPDVDTRDRRITLTFELGKGLSISAPWRPIQNNNNYFSFELGGSPTDWNSLIAIGSFDIEKIVLRDGKIRMAILGGLPDPTYEKIRRWIKHGANSISNIYGRFPLQLPQILVVPVGKHSGPVPWGQVLRGGGSSMQLFIDASRPYDQFIQDWTLVHEFSHFLHPNLGKGSAWLGEGLASYYQNIAQARAGTLSARQAWQKLHDGFQRGIAQTKRGASLEYESRQMSRTRKYMRVYWSGAAVALLADYSLRKNGQSLDEVLSAIQQCCLVENRYWSTKEFMNKLDTIGNTGIFSDLHDEHLYSDEFPNLDHVYKQLGLRVIKDKILFDDGAGASHIRRQIMSVQ